MYEFECKKCTQKYSEITNYDETGKYKDVKCPECGSKKKQRLWSVCHVKFANPRDSSKWDNFSYRAGKTMEEAQDLRRNAEAASHVGADPYGPAAAAQIAADINNDSLYGEVK